MTTTATKPATTVYRCSHCSGRGEVPVHYPDGKGGVELNWQRCRHCDGTGRYEHIEEEQSA